MIVPNSRPSQVPREQAHLKRHKQTLLSGHGALNPELNFLRRARCIGNRHGRMLPRNLKTTILR
jgi:hypothetical protein